MAKTPRCWCRAEFDPQSGAKIPHAHVQRSVLELRSRAAKLINKKLSPKLFYLLLAALGLRCCCVEALDCGEWGHFLVVVRLLIKVVSLVAEHGL